jgi:hypothetical protein
VAAGDINGDGFVDLAVADPLLDTGPGHPKGRVYVYSGSDWHLLYTIDSPGSNAYEEFGIPLTAADVNGDGRADLLVAGQVGRPKDVYLFLGPDASFARSFGSGSVTFSQIPAGDINGDGKAEFLVAPNVLDGSGSSLGTVDGNLADIAGTFADINGGGRPDLIASTHNRVTVFEPPDFSTLATIVVSGSNTFGDYIVAGDMNGDGKSEFAVGDTHGNRVYVYGSVSVTPSPSPTPSPVPVGGIVALPVSGSGPGATALPIALVGGAALAVMVGGWFGGRRWLH